MRDAHVTLAVFFDLDDTLVDHSGAARSAARLFYESVATQTFATSAQQFVESWHGAEERHVSRYLQGELTFQEQRRERIREVLRGSILDSDADNIFSVYLEHYENSWRVFPDVIPCLDNLDSEYMAIITNGDPTQQHEKLVRIGLADRFAAVIACREVGFAKPDPRIFRAACERAGVHPSDAFHIGDSLTSDYEGAREAGLHPILLARGDLEPRANTAVTAVRSLEEVPSVIASIRRAA